MPVVCSVISCQCNNLKSSERFFSLPKARKNSTNQSQALVLKRSAKWLKACGRTWKPNIRVCAHHFVKGEPADLKDTNDVDWVPTLCLPSYQKRPLSSLENVCLESDYQAVAGGGSNEMENYAVPQCSTNNLSVDCTEDSPSFSADESGYLDPPEYEDSDPVEHPIRLIECWNMDLPNDSGIIEYDDDISAENITQNMETFKEDASTQTSSSWVRDSIENKKVCRKLMKENDHLKSSIEGLRTKLSAAEEATRYSIKSLESDNRKCKYITGIASGRVLRLLYETLKDDLPKTACSDMQERMFVLALRKIRLNEPFYSLGLIYNLHHSTVADKVFQMIHAIYPFMSGLVKWPSRDTLKKHMPAAFRDKYGDRVTIILDCFEIPIESPNSGEMIANANVFSFYKHHKTVKILAGVTPAGSYAFISEAFGGRISDCFK